MLVLDDGGAARKRRNDSPGTFAAILALIVITLAAVAFTSAFTHLLVKIAVWSWELIGGLSFG